jgi:hypothetical protein
MRWLRIIFSGKTLLQSLQTKKDAENLSHMVPIRSISAAKYDISHLTKLISLVFQQAGPFSAVDTKLLPEGETW